MNEFEVQLSESRQLAVEEFQAALKSESKLARKSALEKFLRQTFQETAEDPDQLKLMYTTVSSTVLRAVGDESEACRVVGTHILESFVKCIDMNDYQLTYIMPAVVKRIGRPEIVEESEELRLELVRLLGSMNSDITEILKTVTPLLVTATSGRLINKLVHTIIDQIAPHTLEPFISDLNSILCKTITDPFPEVRVETSSCIILVADKLRRVFRMNAESYVKPLLPSLTHQRFKVRVAAIRSIGALVMHGPAKCLELCITPLAEKLFDETAAVRAQAMREVAEWMLNQNDRYSYWHRMLPVVLTSLFDFHEEIRTEAAELWDRIGRKFEDENEQDLKKVSDFLESEPVLHYPEGECEGWQADARYRVMQLLRALLLCAESGSTQHAPVSVACLQRAARDADPRVQLELEKTAEYFGIFIEPETWWPLLKPDMESWATILILSFITSGAKKKLLLNDSAILKEIFSKISDPDQCQTKKTQQQRALLNLADNVMEVLREDAVVVSDQLFTVAFTVYALSEEDVKQRAIDVLEKLRTVVCGYDNLYTLYAEHARSSLAAVTSDAVSWTDASPHYSILYTVMTEFGSALGGVVCELTRLLRETLTEPKLDAKVKVKLFNALSTTLLDKHNNLQYAERDDLLKFYSSIREEVIMPQLVWSAGMTAEAVRCAAVSCLCCLLQSETDGDTDQVELFEKEEDVKKVVDDVTAVLPSLLDDRSALTRQRAVVATMSCVETAHRRNCFDVEHLHKMYFAVLRRLDDSSDDVRSLAGSALVVLFRRRPADYDIVLYRAHVDAVYSTLLIHLDDADAEFRDHILKCLEELSDLDAGLLLKKVNANLPLYRNKEAFDSLQVSLSKLHIAG